MRFIILIFFLLTYVPSHAAIFKTAQSGDWFHASTWAHNSVPTNQTTDTVYIYDSVYITTGNFLSNSVIIIDTFGFFNTTNQIGNAGKIIIYGNMYTSNHIYNFGEIRLVGGNICWKDYAPPSFYHGHPIVGYGTICGYPYIPLDITLTKFECELIHDKIKITWTTENEDNNEYFTIERSYDLINWFEINRTSGSLVSNGVLNYEIWTYPTFGVSYYRLKQTDLDGSIEVFDNFIRYVIYNKNVVVPNPFDDYIYVAEPTNKVEIRNQYWVEILTVVDSQLISTVHLNSGIYYILFNGKQYKMVKI